MLQIPLFTVYPTDLVFDLLFIMRKLSLTVYFTMRFFIFIISFTRLILSITGDLNDRLSRSGLLRFQRYHFRAKNGEREGGS